jgi:formiminoglutamase
MSNFNPYSFKPNKKADSTIQSELLTESIDEAETIILGYPDDLGIERNGGKVGAKEGPDRIRQHLYKMTPQDNNDFRKIYDLGNLNFSEDSELKDRHQIGANEVTKLLKQGKRVLSLGGGHDYGYADGLGFGEHLNEDQKVCIFNFDAHFDLRNLDKGITSGTPFYRLLEKYKERLELIEIGIQKHCNSRELFDLANTYENIHTFTYDTIFPGNEFCEISFDGTRHCWLETQTPCYVSVDIDAFSSSLAPGCSQSWPSGLDVKSFFHMLDLILFHFDVRVLGIYEVSPPLDHNEQTSRLASMIAYRWLQK